MYETIRLNSSTGDISPVKTKEELLLEIIELQQQYIFLNRFGRKDFEYSYGDNWEHLKGEDNCQIFDSITDEIDDMLWDLKNNN